MNGKHSLTASVVALGPFGTRTHSGFYRESFSIIGGNQFAKSNRECGCQAAAVLIHLEMPDPAELLRLAESADGPIELHASAEFPTTDADTRVEDCECLGDESTYYGTAEFDRLKDRWTVWTTEIHRRERPGLIAARRTLGKAMKDAEIRRGSFNNDWATIIIGPGYGGVRVDNITLWPHAWTVKTVIDEEIYPEESVFPGSGDPVDREQAKQMAEAIANSGSCGLKGCPIITAPYLPAAKGGER